MSVKNLPWFRMYAEFATDPKVQMMTETDQRRFVMLLCLYCSNGDETLHDEEIAFQLRISNDEWEQSKKLFIEKGLIDDDNRPCAWDKRQYRSDSSTARVRKHRAAKKQVCNVSVTPPDTDTDTDTDTDIEKINKKETVDKKISKTVSANDLKKLDVDDQVVTEFLELRKRKRANLTPIALKGIQREADKAGVSLSDAMRTCIERGWTGFNAGWLDKPMASKGGYNPSDYFKRRRQAVTQAQELENVIDI